MRLQPAPSDAVCDDTEYVVQTRLRALAARFARGLLSFALLEDQRAQGRPGAGGTRKSVRDEDAHGVDHR
ncbi:hypothetical protein XI07_11985 [Bradyrhizobium sp. CCBAU 11445]|nr:hypothetical protein [Bradyrhizobium sp. CCBAU 25360]MDA9452507.1 hypothetical protein [Bradyrhizobium sp. CCBAU 21360]MDA9454222.1 hypothetical protein [Bradyrhizobium sp. CCBAU 21359]MDA9482734.1 hypothetical protein [Bradyrhizobium sp. CCBAU 11445]